MDEIESLQREVAKLKAQVHIVSISISPLGHPHPLPRHCSFLLPDLWSALIQDTSLTILHDVIPFFSDVLPHNNWSLIFPNCLRISSIYSAHKKV